MADAGAPLAEAAHAGVARGWLCELCWGFDSLGASHTLDTLLVFGTTEIETGLTAAGPHAVAQAQRLSGLMQADTCRSSSPATPAGSATGPDGRVTRVYDAESTVARHPEERSLRIWRDRRFGVLDLTKLLWAIAAK